MYTVILGRYLGKPVEQVVWMRFETRPEYLRWKARDIDPGVCLAEGLPEEIAERLSTMTPAEVLYHAAQVKAILVGVDKLEELMLAAGAIADSNNLHGQFHQAMVAYQRKLDGVEERFQHVN